MIADHLLDILRCPQDHSRLHRASPDLVSRINRAIEAGTLANAAGERVSKPIGEGLIREAGDLMYPVIDEIPVMLPDEAINLAAFSRG